MSQIDAITRYADNPDIARRVISHAGGPALFAKTIGLLSRWRCQRVTNWRRSGIPRVAFLEYPAILPLCQAAEKREKEAA